MGCIVTTTRKQRTMKTWELFLDDRRECPASLNGEDRKVARAVQEAKELVLQYGPPNMMWLDHDLGMVNGKTSDTMEFLNWFMEQCQTVWGYYPEFDYFVISDNPVGRKRIESFMTAYIRLVHGM